MFLKCFFSLKYARSAVTFLVVSSFSGIAVAQQANEGIDQFQSRLWELIRNYPNKSARNEVIDDYQQLIADFEHDPRAAEAMYHLAEVYMSKMGSSRPTDDDKANAITWYKKSIDTANQECRVLNSAKLELAKLLRESEDAVSVQEARALLESVASEISSGTLLEARFRAEMVKQCMSEENHMGAEYHCNQLLSWKPRTDDPPIKDIEITLARSYQLTTTIYFLQRRANSPGTKKGKTAWLDQFSRKHREHEWINDYAVDVGKQIAEIDDPPPTTPDVTLVASDRGRVRTIFLTCNIVAVLVLGMLVVKNHFTKWRKATNSP